MYVYVHTYNHMSKILIAVEINSIFQSEKVFKRKQLSSMYIKLIPAPSVINHIPV